MCSAAITAAAASSCEMEEMKLSLVVRGSASQAIQREAREQQWQDRQQRNEDGEEYGRSPSARLRPTAGRWTWDSEDGGECAAGGRPVTGEHHGEPQQPALAR